jgi:hypothetical protein
MILAALSLLHGDERTEWLYFWASILIILLPVGIFVSMAWLLGRQYFRERRAAAAAEKAAAGHSDVG